MEQYMNRMNTGAWQGQPIVATPLLNPYQPQIFYGNFHNPQRTHVGRLTLGGQQRDSSRFQPHAFQGNNNNPPRGHIISQTFGGHQMDPSRFQGVALVSNPCQPKQINREDRRKGTANSMEEQVAAREMITKIHSPRMV